MMAAQPALEDARIPTKISSDRRRSRPQTASSRGGRRAVHRHDPSAALAGGMEERALHRRCQRDSRPAATLLSVRYRESRSAVGTAACAAFLLLRMAGDGHLFVAILLA